MYWCNLILQAITNRKPGQVGASMYSRSDSQFSVCSQRGKQPRTCTGAWQGGAFPTSTG